MYHMKVFLNVCFTALTQMLEACIWGLWQPRDHISFGTWITTITGSADKI